MLSTAFATKNFFSGIFPWAGGESSPGSRPIVGPRTPARRAATSYAAKIKAVDLPAFQSVATADPMLPPPGTSRAPLKLADETLAFYAEEYERYSTPWKHLVGAEVPNFYQFILWHEQASPVARSAA